MKDIATKIGIPLNTSNFNYWSSTEFENDYAHVYTYIVYIATGDIFYDHNNYKNNVRPIINV